VPEDGRLLPPFSAFRFSGCYLTGRKRETSPFQDAPIPDARKPDPILMPKINAIDLKPGNVLEHQNKLWLVVKRELVQPGKGGAFAQVELRDLRSGNKSTERFRTQETVERVRLDEKEMQFLYMEGDQATFMDNDTFEQVSVPRELIGDAADFLSDGMVCQVMMYEGTPLSIEIAPTVKLTIVEADPVVRGQTASSSYKPGRLENGRRVMIPPHIEAGTRIVVNTADGSYVERAKD
jgi:elongation factor P